MFKNSKSLFLFIVILTASILLYKKQASTLYAQWVLPASVHTIQGIPDGDADRVLGQTDFTTSTPGLSATKMTGPSGLALDLTGRLWVTDFENNRVVSWPSVYDFSNGAAADMVIGQTDLDSNTKSVTASTLNAPESVAVDPTTGALWVADSYHHRLLRYRPPFSTGMSADRVLGQPNFTSGSSNAGQSTAGANTLFFPRGLGFDSQGRLYVADMFNNRVLRFTPPFSNGMNADRVFGQADFTTDQANRDNAGTRRNGLWSPAAVALDSSDSLYVADRDNNRVVRFDAPLSDGMDATIVLGKPDFTTAPAKYEDCKDNPWSGGTLVLDASSLSEPLDLAFNLAGDLIVSDICFHRVLIYENPCSCDTVADHVYGQPDFTSGGENRDGQTAANSLKNPLGLLVDSAATLYIADYANNRVLAFDFADAPSTATPTATSPATATPTATADSQTATSTPTVTAAPTATTTPTATATQPPSGVGDSYEDDNTCNGARTITTTGTAQEHTFHATADQDWVRFSATAGMRYRIEVNVPSGSSADVDMEIYPGCEQLPNPPENPSFSPNARVDFTPPQSGDIFLRLINHDQAIAGAQVAYQLTVRTFDSTVPDRALIILAGRLRLNDSLQGNIHNITQSVYQLFQSNQYDNDHIQYLATDSSLKGYTGAATTANLKAAITTWAAERLGEKGVLTLYLVDHGKPGLLFLDEVNGQRITPTELTTWLTELESKVKDLKVNVIIEACESGSFIQGNAATISKPNRLIITSTSAEHDAKASAQGAYFSDHFLTGLAQGFNLYTSFFEARRVAGQVYAFQDAWIEGDGDGKPNELEDAAVAASRGFNYPGTFDDPWPPHIFSVTPPTAVANFKGQIHAEVRDDIKVRQVWGVVYAPSYQPPPTTQELQSEVLPTILLTELGNNQFAAEYTGFTEAGTYRIVVHADDNEGLKARPVVIEINAGSRVYLPVVNR